MVLDINNKTQYNFYSTTLNKLKKDCLWALWSVFSSFFSLIIAIILICLWCFHIGSEYILDDLKNYTHKEGLHNDEIFAASIFFFVWFIIALIIHAVTIAVIRYKIMRLKNVLEDASLILILYWLSFFFYILSIVATVMTLKRTNKLLEELKRININELDDDNSSNSNILSKKYPRIS